MTPRLPRVTAGEVLKVLKSVGFEEVRQSGSHLVLRKPGGPRVTVPVHAKRILKLALLRAILRDAEMSVDRFMDLL